GDGGGDLERAGDHAGGVVGRPAVRGSRPAHSGGRRRVKRLALVPLLSIAAIAALADLIASDLPLAVRVDGKTFVLPAWSRPVELTGATQSSLAARAEWQWRTPIPFGPNQTFATQSGRTDPAPWAPDAEHLLGADELGRD